MVDFEKFESCPAVLDIREITKILPHRYPFLLVDKVVAIDLLAGTIVAQKNVTINEPFFEGHWPGMPIMPGVLILEALAQSGGILIHQKGYVDKTALFLNINNAKFRNPVRPGDILFLHAEGLHFSNKGGRLKTRAIVNQKIAAEAEMAFALLEKNQV